MKEGNKKKFGLGFGSAMFAMKGIQDMYGQFDHKPEQIAKAQIKVAPSINTQQKPVQVNHKKLPLKVEQKPKIVLKQTNSIQKPQINHQQKNTVQLANKSPIIPKKENEVKEKTVKEQLKTKTQKLFTLQAAKNIFELTINSKLTQWKYQNLNDPNSKPASLIIPEPQISFLFNYRNIKQGSIGNCYFICSLAALTQNIQQLRQRIPNFGKYNSKSQHFTVNMFQSGKFIQMKVSNSFNQSYSKPINNDITTLVLQKAYAQLYGSYEIMNMGHSIDAFRDLSENIAEYIDLKNKDKMKLQIIQAFQLNHPMVIASKQSPKNEFISPKHSYNILSYSQTNNEFYIELRDPRGWTKANFNLPPNLPANLQNGQFWVPYKDLVQSFEVITVSRFLKNSFYFYKAFSHKDLPQNGLSSIIFEVNQNTNLSASIHQKHKKFFDQKYQYSVINIMLCEVDEKMNIIRTIKTNFNSNQVCSLSINLDKGRYVMVGQIHPFRNSKQYHFLDEIFTLSFNSDKEISNFSLVSQFNLTKALMLFIKENPEQFKQIITKQNLHRYHGTLFGKVCIFYENLSQKNVIQELQFDAQNVEIKQKKVMLGKQERKLIMCPIGPLNNCSHKCSFKSKTFYSK